MDARRVSGFLSASKVCGVSEETKPQKICVICGEDCSQQRRIRDDRGRYYHKNCYEQARKAEKEKKKKKKAARQAFPDDHTVPLQLSASEAPDPYALDTDVVEKPSAGIGSELEEEGQPTKICPNCQHRMPVDHATCGHCGYNTLTGERRPATYAEMAALRVGKTGGGKIWPFVVGFIALAAGIGGLIFYGLAVAHSLHEHGTSGAENIVRLVVVSIGAFLALWLLVAAIGILRRRQMAMVWMQRWALLKLFLGIVGFIALIVAIFAVDGTDRTIDEEFGTRVVSEGVTALLAWGLPRLGWLLLWPVCILVWFSRESVQRHIGEWH